MKNWGMKRVYWRTGFGEDPGLGALAAARAALDVGAATLDAAVGEPSGAT
jgi:hypothetical protein